MTKKYEHFYQLCQDGYIDEVKSIVRKKNLNINRRDKYGHTALEYACSKERIEVVNYLLSNPYLIINNQNDMGDTALHVACSKNTNSEIVTRLLMCGADVNIRNNHGETPLYIACSKGKLDIMELLMTYNADLYSMTDYGYTPFYVLCFRQNIEGIELFLDQGYKPSDSDIGEGKDFTKYNLDLDPDDSTVNTQTEATASSSVTNSTILNNKLRLSRHHQSYLNELKQQQLNMTFIYYIKRRDIINIEELINQGADVNYQTRCNYTALHYLCEDDGILSIDSSMINNGSYSHQPSSYPSLDNNTGEISHSMNQSISISFNTKSNLNLKIIELLWQNGINIESVSDGGWTPLHIACHRGNVMAAKFLIDHGANVNALTMHHMTPLHFASYFGHEAIVRLLLDTGSKLMINLENKDGKIPLDVAVEKDYNTITMLILERMKELNLVKVKVEKKKVKRNSVNHPSTSNNITTSDNNNCIIRIVHNEKIINSTKKKNLEKENNEISTEQITKENKHSSEQQNNKTKKVMNKDSLINDDQKNEKNEVKKLKEEIKEEIKLQESIEKENEI